MQEARKKPAVVGFLVPDPGDDRRKWGDKKPINKKSLVNLTTACKINQYSASRDRQTLNKFLSVCDKSMLCYPSELNLTDIMPLGVPLLDLLAVDTKQRYDSYKYPNVDEITLFQNNRGIDFNSLKPVKISTPLEVREITVGVSSDQEILSIWDWCDKKLEEEFEIYPSGTVSVDVEEIRIRKSDKNLILNAVGSSEPVITGSKLSPGDKYYQWPVKILIGNGLRFMIVVSWPAEQVKNGIESYRIWPYKPQDILIDFLSSLPTAVGVGIKNDTSGLSNHYSEFNPLHPLKMAPWLDLGPLAALCGWRLQATNMAALSMGIIGGLLDKISSRADGKWCLPWNTLPQEFKIYAAGDVKFGHIAFVVLSSILMRDIFPDPDSAGFAADHTQESMVDCVCTWIRNSLCETELWFDQRALPGDRKELIDCIRERVEYKPNKFRFSYTPPTRVTIWADLLGNWPPLSLGGPRFLHNVRQHVTVQNEILKKVSWEKWGKFSAYQDPKEQGFVLYMTFGQPNISECSPDQPVPGGKLGLVNHPQLSKPIFRINPETMQIGTLIRTAGVQGRSQRHGVYEYARLHPEKIVNILKRFEKTGDISQEYWLQHDSLYEDLRLMVMRLHDQVPKKIEWIEKRICSRLKNTIAEEELAVFNARETLRIRELRLALLKEVEKEDFSMRRIGVVNVLPPLYKNKKSSLPARMKTTNLPFPLMKSLSGSTSKLRRVVLTEPEREESRKVVLVDPNVNIENDEVMIIEESEEQEVVTIQPEDPLRPPPIQEETPRVPLFLRRKRAAAAAAIETSSCARLKPKIELVSGEEKRNSQSSVRYMPAGSEDDYFDDFEQFLSTCDTSEPHTSQDLNDDPANHADWPNFEDM